MIRLKLGILILILFSVTTLAERTRLRPGTNAFSPQQDIDMGQQAAKEAEKEFTLITDRDATAYVAALGQQLAAVAPNEFKFPFTFKIVNDRAINAFALPGGPVYVNRGAIEAADNEAQIAGVIGHEISHVILRHGTNQATKAQYAQGLGALAGILGGNIGKIAGGVGGLAASSVLLRYSRDAESQADLMGTQILYDKGYNPHAMAEFFDKLAKEHKGSSTEQFFSNHPIPENRIAKVNAEIAKIGPVSPNPRTDSTDFQRVKRALLAMPEPPKAPAAKPADATAAPAAPSTRMTDFQVAGLQLRHPDNWKPAVQGTNVTIAPAGGIVGQGDLAYGFLVDVFKPQNANNLDQATQQFLQNLQRGNAAMKIVRSRVQSRVDGQAAQLAEATNDSPAGGQETDVITTVLKANGDLQYFVEVAPTKDFAKYQAAFRAIMDSVRLR